MLDMMRNRSAPAPRPVDPTLVLTREAFREAESGRPSTSAAVEVAAIKDGFNRVAAQNAADAAYINPVVAAVHALTPPSDDFNFNSALQSSSASSASSAARAPAPVRGHYRFVADPAGGAFTPQDGRVRRSHCTWTDNSSSEE